MTLLDHIKLELRAILTNPVVVLTVFGGVIFYSFLYHFPTATKRRVSNLSRWSTSIKVKPASNLREW